MKTKILKIITLTIFLFQPGLNYCQNQPPKQIIKNLTITGNKAANREQIVGWLDWKEGTRFDESAVLARCKDVLHGYLELGYPFAIIDSVRYLFSSDSSFVDLQVFIHEGLKTNVGKIQLMNGDSTFIKNLMRNFNTRHGQSFIPSDFAVDMNEVLNQYENTGYPFTVLLVDSIRVESKNNSARINLQLFAKTGNRVHIDEIQILGNKLTKPHVLTRELRIKPGSVYNQRRIDKIPSRLTRLGFIKSVREPQITISEDNRGILLVEIEEGNASKMDGLLGYNPGTEIEPGFFTGLIDLALGNLFGTGRSVEVHWEKRDRNTQEMRFGYREPWVLGYPVHTGFSFEQLIQDTTYIRRTTMLGFELPLSETLSAFTTISSSEVNPDSIGNVIYGLPDSRTMAFSFGIDYDTRDDLINPQRGLRYRTLFEYGRKRNLGPEELITQNNLKKSIDNKKWEIDFEWNLPLFKYQVLHFGLVGKQLESTEAFIPITDQFRFGGARTLRGYREEQFRGSRVAWSNLEYRYILSKRSRAFIFFDSGYYWRKEENGKFENAKIGYGLGIRLETGLGIMGIDYGLGEGDSFFSGKVHVGLVNQF